MAKQTSLLTVSGKIGEQVGVKTKRGVHLRQAPKKKTNRTVSPAFRLQANSSAVLAPLAGSINTAVRQYGRNFISTGFYHQLLKTFRKIKDQHLSILLNSIVRADLHSGYKFQDLCPIPAFEFNNTKTQYVLEAEVQGPAFPVKGANCFFLEFILLVWSERDTGIRHNGQATSWMKMDDSFPLYTTLKFKRTAKDTDYLLACRCGRH